jgi:hypothetical protein
MSLIKKVLLALLLALTALIWVPICIAVGVFIAVYGRREHYDNEAFAATDELFRRQNAKSKTKSRYGRGGRRGSKRITVGDL